MSGIPLPDKSLSGEQSFWDRLGNKCGWRSDAKRARTVETLEQQEGKHLVSGLSRTANNARPMIELSQCTGIMLVMHTFSTYRPMIKNYDYYPYQFTTRFVHRSVDVLVADEHSVWTRSFGEVLSGAGHQLGDGGSLFGDLETQVVVVR